jgi:hypothetical protein
MNEISPFELYEGLLGFGMFSENIPPAFSSKDFFDYCVANVPSFENKSHSYVQYDCMRNTNIIRELGIPTPMAYEQLCRCIMDNWPSIIQHFSQCTADQTHIISRIHIRKMAETPKLFRMNYDNWKVDGNPEVDLLIGSRYIVHADISKCFPSIYSHSLPWALVGKTYAKTKQGRDRSQWQNQLDHVVQICKYGETHGLLIGPHASNLLGEIILTAVDKELWAKGWKYTRHIDDYTCYVDSVENAQLFLVDLNAELGKFDLSVNDKKTEVSKLPTALAAQWTRQVGNPRLFLRNEIFDYISARSYFDSAIEIMQNNKENAAILNYAIKALPVDIMSEQAKILCVKTIFHLCLLYPYLVHIIDEFVFERFGVDQDKIAAFANQLFNQEIKVRNYDAVCYALFFSIKYGFVIGSLSAQDAVGSESCIYKLFAFLHFKKYNNKAEGAILKAHALELKKNDEDLDQNWLFVYEALPQSKLPGDWKQLKNNKISFIRKEYQV